MMRLIDNFYLDADDRQYMLKEWDGIARQTKGSPDIKATWFIQKLEGVFDQLITLMIRRKISKSETIEISDLKLAIFEETERLRAMFPKDDSEALERIDEEQVGTERRQKG